MQAAAMQIIYKGVFQWFLKLIVGVQFTDCRFLKKEKQFIILANHNSHLDTLSLLASLPGDLLWKVKPVAAEDYFGKTRFQASISNFFINTLLIRRKGEKDSEHDPIRKMLEAIDAGYSLILFPEGTRGKPEQMGKIKSGIARILSLRPEVKYIPVFMTGMGRSLPKGKMILLPYKASIYYGMPALVKSTDTHEILEQITGDFERMKEKYQVVFDEEEEQMLFFKRNISKLSDEELLIHYTQSGDTEYFGELYNRYIPLLYGLCLKYLHDEDRAQEAVMQLFEDLLPKLGNYEIKVFKPWLYRVAKNHCLQLLRKENKEIPLDYTVNIMESDEFLHLLSEEESSEEQLKALHHCLEKLPEEQRTSITRFFLEEMSYADIVEQTGFTLNNVKSYIQNGKRNLKICIKKQAL